MEEARSLILQRSDQNEGNSKEAGGGRCGCRETGLFSFLFGVEYQILLFPLEGEPGREQARAALESLYRLLFRVSAGASKRAPRPVCRIYEKGGAPGENKGFYMDLL